MRTLSTDIEELGSKIFQDDQLILKMLSSLQHNNILSPKLTSKTDISKRDTHSKNISLTNTTPKKRKSSQQKHYMSNTTKTVKRFNTSPTLIFQKSSIPKSTQKQSTNRYHPLLKTSKKMPKSIQQTDHRTESNLMKLKKLSEKLIPKITNKFIYSKKSHIIHFQNHIN